MREMVDTRARWHAPSRTPVAETTEVGLSIGNGEELRRQVEETLPEVPTQPGVPLRVGTDVSARLVGEPSDVSISPSDAIDASTGSDIALLWTWNIHPKHPNDRLKLSAHLTMTVPGTEHKLTRTLNLVLERHSYRQLHRPPGIHQLRDVGRDRRRVRRCHRLAAA